MWIENIYNAHEYGKFKPKYKYTLVQWAQIQIEKLSV